MSHIDTEDSAADLKASDPAARPESTGTTRHGRHAKGDWATIAKAVKEPAYKGPWVSSREDVPAVLETEAAIFGIFSSNTWRSGWAHSKIDAKAAATACLRLGVLDLQRVASASYITV